MAQLMSIKKNVDVQPGVGVPAIFHCSQGDKGTRIILGLLNNNDNYTIPEDTTAIIRGSRADGTLFTEITADIDTTTEIKFNLTEDMTSVAGPVECEAVMTSGPANIIGTANFIIDVEKSPASIGSVFPATDAAETWLRDELTNLDISGLDNESVVDAINSKASESTIAPEFDASASYTAGSYVLKNGVLYSFTADHTGAWTGSDAEDVTVGGELNRIEGSGGSGTGLTEDIKQALLTIAEKVAYIDDDGQDYYDALYDALYPPAGLVRITAVYTQSGVVTNWNTLNDLKTDLVVTAYFDNGTSQTVVNYALTGTLEAPQSTITVAYGGKTATFTVIVTYSDVPTGYTAYDYIELTDVPTSGTAARYYTIITDAQMSSDYTVEISLGFGSNRVPNLSADPIIGTRNGGSGTLEYALYMRSNDGLCKVHLWGTEKTPTPKISTSGRNTLKILPVGKSETYPDNNVVEINGTQYNTELSIVDTLASPWFGFFNYATSATGHPTSTTYYRGYVIGETKVTDADGNEVYHFIPAKNSDDIYGFYEKVHNRFYYNNYNDGALLSHYTGGNWG